MQEVTATFDKDTFRTHRYVIDAGQAVVGTIYVPKQSKVPSQVIINLRTKSDVGGTEDE